MGSGRGGPGRGRPRADGLPLAAAAARDRARTRSAVRRDDAGLLREHVRRQLPAGRSRRRRRANGGPLASQHTGCRCAGLCGRRRPARRRVRAHRGGRRPVHRAAGPRGMGAGRGARRLSRHHRRDAPAAVRFQDSDWARPLAHGTPSAAHPAHGREGTGGDQTGTVTIGTGWPSCSSGRSSFRCCAFCRRGVWGCRSASRSALPGTSRSFRSSSS